MRAYNYEFDGEYEIEDRDDLEIDAWSALSDEDIEKIKEYKLETRDLGYD